MLLNGKMYSDHYEIVNYGSGMTFEANSSFRIEIPKEILSLNIVLIFLKTTDKTLLNTSFDRQTNELKLEFKYLQSSLSFGTRNPIEMEYKGEKFFLRLWITVMGKGECAKKIDYVIFKEISNEQ